MVHTRNGSSYSAQPDGSGQGRGKTRTRSSKSSSRKTHLEDARTAPHSTRSVPTNFDVNSEPELTEGIILRAEPFPSGSHGDISVPIQKLVQRSKRRGVRNMPKPLAGGHELLLTHKELSGPEEGIGNDSSFGRGASGVYQLQTSSRNIQREAQRTSEDKERSQEPSLKGKGEENWHRPYPQGYRIPKLEPSAVDSVFNMARTLMEFTAKEQERMNRNFPRK
ncbi:hypothetical protein O181_125759 [Austropuccinia psidii MF-1]|uniref:Uncharacterized protein n=1 Tax=Austropuccinia psidii MF-1 TaxID=1389203 RepID=A0A9Q3KUR7_9BASI|nr:hypothetical protein [Austropuccinia psidii MF-1]